jgi:hypothetical protein
MHGTPLIYTKLLGGPWYRGSIFYIVLLVSHYTMYFVRSGGNTDCNSQEIFHIYGPKFCMQFVSPTKLLVTSLLVLLLPPASAPYCQMPETLGSVPHSARDQKSGTEQLLIRAVGSNSVYSLLCISSWLKIVIRQCRPTICGLPPVLEPV